MTLAKLSINDRSDSMQPRVPNLLPPLTPATQVTVFSLKKGERAHEIWFRDQVDRFQKADDVWTTAFLERVIIVLPTGSNNEDATTLTRQLPQSWKTRTCHIAQLSHPSQDVPTGPYYFGAGQLHKLYRLYEDVQEAFMLAIRPKIQQGNPFENLCLSGEFPPCLAVAVPPRPCDTDFLSAHPLRGFRFAIKDLFQLRGLRTTVGCRAYHAVADPAEQTASCIQKLLHLGAELVGTLKLGSLITKEEPAEAADYGAPFNPRGDGYQSAWSSSGGSGAAIASYDWLDFTVATDTTGSSRRPALANGIFQLRVSKGSLDPKGTVPSFKPFDSPSIFARDLQVLSQVAQYWPDHMPKSNPEKPVIIATLADYAIDDPMQAGLIQDFTKDLCTALGAHHKELSIAALWKANPPSEANGMSVADFLDTTTGVNSFCYGLYHELDEFRAKYHEKYDKEPYINPTTRWRWDVAEGVSAAEHLEAMNRLAVYKTWFNEHVLRVGKQRTLVVFPITKQEVDYRDANADPPTAPSAFQQLWLAPILGAPEMSVPVGEIKYFSRVSRRDEYLPMVVSVLAEAGQDMQLVSSIRQTLEHAKRPTCVKTGSRMF